MSKYIGTFEYEEFEVPMAQIEKYRKKIQLFEILSSYLLFYFKTVPLRYTKFMFSTYFSKSYIQHSRDCRST